MRRFRFQLDPVLDMRRTAERDRQRAFADLERKRAEIERRIRQHQRNLTEGREALRQAIVGRVDLTVIRAHARVVIDVMRRADQLVLELAALQKEIDRAQEALIEATRNRRAIEIVRERRLLDWKKEANRAAQRELDDLTSTRAGRGGNRP